VSEVDHQGTDEGRCTMIAGVAMLVLALGAVVMVAVAPARRG
jgi:hypothetical protein